MACVTLDLAGGTVAAFTYPATDTRRTGQFIIVDAGNNNGVYSLQRNDGTNDLFALAWYEPKPAGAGTTTTAWFGRKPGTF
jgi:hypothetical protein